MSEDPDYDSPLPASSLPTAEPHELETYGKDNPLKVAADAITAAAQAALAEDGAPATKEQHLAEETKKADEAGRRLLVEEEQKPELPTNVVPAWAKIPSAAADGSPFRFPKGRKVMFLRFRARLTDVPLRLPGGEDRQCILWPLSVGDLRFAIDRCHGNIARAADEMAKQMIRSIDGLPVDWTTGGVANNPEQFWGEIGQAYRVQLTRICNQLSTLSGVELRDFLENCVALVIPG